MDRMDRIDRDGMGSTGMLAWIALHLSLSCPNSGYIAQWYIMLAHHRDALYGDIHGFRSDVSVHETVVVQGADAS